MAERLFTLMGWPDLIDDPHFKTNMQRVQHRDELDLIVGVWIAQRTLAEANGPALKRLTSLPALFTTLDNSWKTLTFVNEESWLKSPIEIWVPCLCPTLCHGSHGLQVPSVTRS